MGDDNRRPINATQALVLGFFGLAWLSLVVILVLAPETYDTILGLPAGDRRPAEIGFLGALSVLLLFLGVGVARGWRWTFWLVLLAFLLGVIRVPVSLLQLTGRLPASGPRWYELFQGVIGTVQFCLGLAMLAGYRRESVWGSFLRG